jgi:hypothetical protein
MKARVKATGEIVRVLQTSNGDYEEFVTHNLYCPDELAFDVTDKDAIYNKGCQDGWDEAVKSEIPKIHPILKGSDPDYWTRLEHQYAGMAMQGMIRRAYEAYCDDCANYDNMIFEDAQALLKDHAEALADVCVEYAHALVEELKGKEERK